MDLTPLERAGWFDPAAADADDVRAMLEHLVGVGVELDELLHAFEHDYVPSAGLGPLLRRGEVSAQQVADRIGVDATQVVDTYRLIGVRIDDPTEPILLHEEADLLHAMYEAQEAFEGTEVDEILRTTSASLTMLAESIVSVFVGGTEARIDRSSGVSWLERTVITQRSGELGLRFGRTIGLFFRHHLREAIERQRHSMAGTSDRHLRHMAVGFVDLVGFTTLSAATEVHELLDLIRDFESRSYDIATRAGGRVVKIIGDEIMISALSVDVACEIVLGVIEEFRTGGAAPRGGLAAGEVIGRLGDFFGPVVNLASRLVDQAVPGEVLADASLHDRITGPFRCEPAGRRMLKGFVEPVPVVSILRA